METIEAEINSIFNRIKNLKQNTKKTYKELMELSEQQYNDQVVSLEVKTLFSDVSERKQAKTLLLKYLGDFSIETIADKNTLKQMIYFEVIQFRLQTKLNETYKRDQVVPASSLRTLHENSKTIKELKDSLGLNKTKGEQATDVYQKIQLMKKQFKVWMGENQASRQLVCPNCKQMVMLKIRTDVWDAQKHPFFKDRILGNVALVKLYLNNTITKQQVASVLEVSPDYVDWLITKWKIKK